MHVEHGEASSMRKLRVKCELTVSRVSSLLHIVSDLVHSIARCLGVNLFLFFFK